MHIAELVINISVPQKQHLLKAGKAFLRIRNTGFTITTNDNPPRCQGTWQIIHVRKYGGSGLFRFETGMQYEYAWQDLISFRTNFEVIYI